MQERPTGAFAEAWSGLMLASDVTLVDISKCLGSVMCTKDQKEILNVKKASFLLANAMNKKALKEIEGAVLLPLPFGLAPLLPIMALVVDWQYTCCMQKQLIRKRKCLTAGLRT